MRLKTIKQIGGNEMIKKQLLGILVILAIFAFCGAAIAAESKTIHQKNSLSRVMGSRTIVGTINDDGVLVDEGGVLYMLGEDDKGAEVADNSGKKVEVKGTVEESSDGTKTITIESYKVMEE